MWTKVTSGVTSGLGITPEILALNLNYISFIVDLLLIVVVLRKNNIWVYLPNLQALMV